MDEIVTAEDLLPVTNNILDGIINGIKQYWPIGIAVIAICIIIIKFKKGRG